MPPHPFTDNEMQIYYEKGRKFNGVYSGNHLSKIQYGLYIINLDRYESVETHWIALYVNVKNASYFDSFGVEHTRN